MGIALAASFCVLLLSGCMLPMRAPAEVVGRIADGLSSGGSGWKIGDWIPGTITLESSYTTLVMPMKIQLSRGTGGMTAKNPETGESFSGQYHGRGTPRVGQWVPADAVLRGDQGSTLSVKMKILPARSPTRPRGKGTATDSQGNAYTVAF